MNLTVKQSDWATETLMEALFWRNGMTPEEYEEERKYFANNFQRYMNGEYVPLWRQRDLKNF